MASLAAVAESARADVVFDLANQADVPAETDPKKLCFGYALPTSFALTSHAWLLGSVGVQRWRAPLACSVGAQRWRAVACSVNAALACSVGVQR